MEFTAIQFLFVIISSVVVMGRNYSDESELNRTESSQNVSEAGVLLNNDEGFEAMETGNFTEECDVTLDPYIEPSCCQERHSEDYGSGCVFFKACNKKNHCQFTAWFYPGVVLIGMLSFITCCCPNTFTFGRFCLKQLRKRFGGRVGGHFGGSDAHFQMKDIAKSPKDSEVVTDAPIDDNIEVLGTPMNVESRIEDQVDPAPSDDNIEEHDATKEEVESQIKVQIHSPHPFAADSSSDHQV